MVHLLEVLLEVFDDGIITSYLWRPHAMQETHKRGSGCAEKHALELFLPRQDSYCYLLCSVMGLTASRGLENRIVQLLLKYLHL